jgi:hypothetical protein
VPTQHPSRFADVRDSEKFAAEIARAAISHELVPAEEPEGRFLWFFGPQHVYGP